ncbi:MAG: NAD-dependent epimerase/dehydratase family protein, partial [Gemmatimonadota bacterium]
GSEGVDGAGSVSTVFLTGGTGVIGSHVAERLRRRGDAVVALVRPSSDARHLEALGCELAVGDLADPPEALAARVRGADAVVHAAAKVFQAGSRAEYLRVNVEGTERMLAAAARAGPRFVHLSSVAVYAGLPMDAPLTEDRWTEADPARQNRYAASKHLSERAAWRAHEAGDVRLTTVRPSVVYGERDRSATPVLVRYASLPIVPLVDGGRHTLPVVYAGNVARGVVAALDRPDSVGRAYNLALDAPVTGRELAELIARGLGRRLRTVSVPATPLRSLATAIDAAARAIPGLRPPDLRRAARSLAVDNPYDSARARLELGWSGLVPHAEGVRRTMAWWRERG